MTDHASIYSICVDCLLIAIIGYLQEEQGGYY